MSRIAPALEEQGVEVEVTGLEGSTLVLRARRTAPGMPVAFLVKLIEGTYRRYLPEITRVRLEGYDPGPGRPPPPPAPPPAAGPRVRGLEGVDLAGLDRARAARALESFVAVMLPRGARRLKVCGLADPAARRAAEKWAHFYRGAYHSLHPQGQDENSWIVHFDQECHKRDCSAGMPEEVMPGSLMIIE